MINIFRANSHTQRQWDVVHYMKKQVTVHVLVGLRVPPCQHDRSLLHTERLCWLEVGAAAEEWCIPQIIRQSCSHWGGWCPHHAMMTLSGCVTYDVCTNSKHIGRCCCSSRLFYVGHTRFTGAQRGRKDVFHATHKGRKNNALEMWLLVSQEITTRSYVAHIYDIEPWKKLHSYVFFHF